MQQDSSTVSVRFNATASQAKSRPVYQYDYGLTLVVYGQTNTVAQVHFSNSITSEAINHQTSITSDGGVSVPIPSIQLAQGKDINAFLYVEDDTSGFTTRTVFIPVIPRAKPEHITLESESMGPVNELSASLTKLIEEVEGLKADLESTKFYVNPDDGCLYMESN